MSRYSDVCAGAVVSCRFVLPHKPFSSRHAVGASQSHAARSSSPPGECPPLPLRAVGLRPTAQSPPPPLPAAATGAPASPPSGRSLASPAASRTSPRPPRPARSTTPTAPSPASGRDPPTCLVEQSSPSASPPAPAASTLAVLLASNPPSQPPLAAPPQLASSQAPVQRSGTAESLRNGAELLPITGGDAITMAAHGPPLSPP